MRRLLALAIALTPPLSIASAQNMTGLVVSSCGAVPTLFTAARPGPFTVDTTGNMCFGTGGSVSAAATVGNPDATGLVVPSCGNQAFTAGRPGPFTIDQHGNVCN